MGLLMKGQWVDRWYDTESNNGRFARSEAQFRNWVTADGSAGPTGLPLGAQNPDLSPVERSGIDDLSVSG